MFISATKFSSIAMTLLLLATLVNPSSNAQFIQGIIPGTLTYLRLTDSQTREYVRLSTTDLQAFAVTDQQCAVASPSGSLVAISTPLVDRLIVVEVEGNVVVFEQRWSEDWQPCNFTWITDNQLRFSNREDSTTSLTLSTGEIAPDSPSIIEQFAPLPYKVPLEPAIASPQGDVVLYNQCTGGKIDGEARYCLGDSQIVIYDLRRQNIIEILEDANSLILGDSLDDLGQGVPNPPAVFWSPSGRYVLYTPMSSLSGRIYDIETDRYYGLNLPSGLLLTSLFGNLQWSGDETHVGFWASDFTEVSPTAMQFFVSYTLTGEITSVINEQGYNVTQWRWSPDNHAIAFINRDSQLILLSLEDERESLIDENVYSIIAWTP